MTINIDLSQGEVTALEDFLTTQVVAEPDPETQQPRLRPLYDGPEDYIRTVVNHAVAFAESRT